jgi:hypothetical protein
MNEPETNGHEDKTNGHNGNSDEQELVQQVDAAPNNNATTAPETHTQNQHEPSTWSKILEATLYLAHHYWDAPREKSKKADVAIVILTLAIAIAAIWSACIFQRQLTLARETMESQTRPWVGNGEIKVRQTTFLVYPTNPIQARTQV